MGCGEKYFKKAFGINYKADHVLIRGNDLYWNYDLDITFNKVSLRGNTLNMAVKNFIEGLKKTTNNLENVSESITCDKWQSKGKSNLAYLFKEYIRSYLLNMPFLFHFWNIEYLLTSQLRLDFRVIFGEREKDSILQQALIPARETYFAKERKNLEKIALGIAKNQKINTDKLISNHLKKFGFTSFVLQVGEPLSKATVLERLNNLLGDDIFTKARNTQINIRKDRKIALAILRKLSIFPEIYERVLLAQELMFWKNQRLDILFKSDLKVKPLFDAIAKLMGLSYKEFVYLRYAEIITWFNQEKLPTKREIRKRINSYALFLKNGKIFLYTDKNKYPKVHEDSEKATLTNEGNLEGKVAYQGKVKGRVRIIFSLEDIHTIKKGEVLVTKMTRPEMIMGLEKAAAFVTDQGGMLSHAAIVSREMRKPCIVGTKIATQIFKNGDLIEVDANKGIVRKLGK